MFEATFGTPHSLNFRKTGRRGVRVSIFHIWMPNKTYAKIKGLSGSVLRSTVVDALVQQAEREASILHFTI